MRLLKRILIGVVPAIALAVSVLVVRITTRPTAATIAGKVVDARKGTAIADAKVIITFWNRSILSKASPCKYGTTTTAGGQFEISVEPGFRISKIDAGACGPDGQVIVKQEVESDSIRLALPERADWMTLPDYGYESFSGGWSGETTWLENEAKSGPR